MATNEDSRNPSNRGSASLWYEIRDNTSAANDNTSNQRNSLTLSPRFYLFLNVIHFIVLFSLGLFFIWFFVDLHVHKHDGKLDIVDWMVIFWIIRSAWSVLNGFYASNYQRRGLPNSKRLNMSILCSNMTFVLWISYAFLLIYLDFKTTSNAYSYYTCTILFWISFTIFILPKTFYFILLGLFYFLLFILVRAGVRDNPNSNSKTPKEIIAKLRPKKFRDVKDDILESGTASNKLNDLQVEYSTPTCPICIVELISNDYVIIMPCDQRHYFHKSCLLSWLDRSQECPICRTNIVDYYKVT